MDVAKLLVAFAVLGFMTWIWSNVTSALSRMVLEAMA